MKNIAFKTSTAQRIYNGYILRVERSVSILSKDDQMDMLMEINSHIFESIRNENETNEVDSLLTVLDKLGQPEEFLVPIVAEKKLEQATHTFNPKHVWQAIRLNGTKGLAYFIISLSYLFLFAFIFLIIAKIMAPTKTGMFYLDNDFKAFGYVSNTNDMTEVLGWWFLPIVIISAALFYILITLLFRLTKGK